MCGTEQILPITVTFDLGQNLGKKGCFSFSAPRGNEDSIVAPFPEDVQPLGREPLASSSNGTCTGFATP